MPKNQNNDREEFEKMLENKTSFSKNGSDYEHLSWGYNDEFESDEEVEAIWSWIQSYTQKKVSEALNLIAEDQGWEESRDIYADVLELPLKYPKLMEAYKKRNHIKGKIILDSQLSKEKQNDR